MIDYNSIRFPIVIVSTPRSGSTALARHLQKKMDHVETFIEPEKDINDLNKFLKFVETNNKFIVKTHLSDFNKYPANIEHYLLNSPKPYRIAIERKDVIKQSLSMYVEFYRKRWSYRAGDAFKKDVIPIDYNRISNIIDFYLDQNRVFAESNIAFDIKLVFEDLIFEDTGTIRTPRPKNYDLLVEAVKKTYETHKKA